MIDIRRIRTSAARYLDRHEDSDENPAIRRLDPASRSTK
jgi:hypothetical protein